MKANLFCEVLMRKFLFLLCMLLPLQACSVLELLPRPAPASTFTATTSPTASYTPTITLTPTRTLTPTPRNTATLIISEFNTAVVLVTDAGPQVFATLADFVATPGASTGGFESVELTQGHIYYGVCKDNYTKMTVKVEHPEEVGVYLFFGSVWQAGDTTPGTVRSPPTMAAGIFSIRCGPITSLNAKFSRRVLIVAPPKPEQVYRLLEG
jgi:hypothetical protein